MATFIHSLMLTSDVHIFELLCPRNSSLTGFTVETNTQRRLNSFCSNLWLGDRGGGRYRQKPEGRNQSPIICYYNHKEENKLDDVG